MSIVNRTPVPRSVRALAALADPDYSDAFEVDTASAAPRSPEQWARATFEGAPAAMRWFLLASWRGALGLRLRRPLHSADHVLGWRIIDRAADSVTLELRSVLLTSHLVFWLDDGKLVFSSSVRYDHKATAAIWPPASVIHRRVLRYLLKHAARQPAA